MFSFRTQLRAVRLFLIEEYAAKLDITTSDHLVVTPEEEAAELEACIRENEKWNESIALVRAERIEKNLAERRKFILERLELKEERQREVIEKANELVRLEKVFNHIR